MNLQHQPAVGVADLVRIGAAAHAEDLIGLVDGHRLPVGRVSAGMGAAVAAAPFGAVNAVEVGFQQLRRFRVVDPAIAQQRKQLLEAELVDQPAAKRPFEDGALELSGVVVERHAEIDRLDIRGLARRRPAEAPGRLGDAARAQQHGQQPGRDQGGIGDAAGYGHIGRDAETEERDGPFEDPQKHPGVGALDPPDQQIEADDDRDDEDQIGHCPTPTVLSRSAW